VQHFTQFIYDGNQVYIYSAKLNDEYEHRPLKWSFYYVPALQPVKSSNTTDWVWVTKTEVRMKLALGNDQIEDAARRAIVRRFDAEVAANYSRFWVVAPLMIDSMTGFVVQVSGDPVEGVAPYRIAHPSALAIIFRFECSHVDTARDIVAKLIDGDYEVEVNFYFAGFKHVSSNIVSITGEHLKTVLSKTMADGGNSNAKYIHRDQAKEFIGKYSSNVKKMMYMEKPGVDLSVLTSGLDEQFTALLYQGMNSATETQLSAKLYDQVWHSSDLNPDRLTNELSRLFTLNNTATQKYNNTDIFFNVNSQSAHVSSGTSNLGGGVNVLGIFGASGSSSTRNNEASNRNDDKTTHDIMSASDIQRRIGQHSIEIEWTGEKFEPKSFHVFKLTDVTNKLQVAIISKHMYAEKQNGAISRRVSALNGPTIVAAAHSSTIFAGEIRLFAGGSSPPFKWLICNGALLARSDYPRLFHVIGTLYGTGDEGEMYFRLPDLRGRFPLGVDENETYVSQATQLGMAGGKASHQLLKEELPAHSHGKGTFSTGLDGSHSHSIYDPGHDHGGTTYGSGQFTISKRAILTEWKDVSEDNILGQGSHTHGIRSDATGITINSNGLHTHHIYGESAATGSGQAFPTISPYQTVHYIIYTA
ncbi:unnamed protein product, partial [Rotaria magnacalcarata]